MRIAMIGQKTNALGVGGVETHVNRLAEEMERRGNRVTVFARRGYPHVALSPPSAVRTRPCIPTKHLEAITHSAWCSLETSLRPYDIVHYHGVGPAITIPLARLRPGQRVCVTIHDQDYNKAKWSPAARRILRAGEAVACRFADEIVVVAGYLGRHLESTYARSAHVIPHGAEELEAIPPGEQLHRFGLTPGRYLVFVGRLVPEKGCDNLILALRQSSTRHKLAIIGGSSHSDGYVDHLKSLAAGDPRIVFTGRQTDEALAELRSNAAAYILPSLQEGLPLSLLEALWLGLRVVATDIPAVAEIGDQALTGDLELVPPNDIESLRERIDSLEYPMPANVPGRFPWPTWEAVGAQTEHVYLSAQGIRPEAIPAGGLSHG